MSPASKIKNIPYKSFLIVKESKCYLAILKGFEFNIIINYFIHFLYII